MTIEISKRYHGRFSNMRFSATGMDGYEKIVFGTNKE